MFFIYMQGIQLYVDIRDKDDGNNSQRIHAFVLGIDTIGGLAVGESSGNRTVQSVETRVTVILVVNIILL